MNFEISKAFQKSYRLKDEQLAAAILSVIDEINHAEQLSDITHLKKLKGYQTAYRIRVGSYRIGVFIEPDTSGQLSVTLSAFSHRKGIYKKFP